MQQYANWKIYLNNDFHFFIHLHNVIFKPKLIIFFTTSVSIQNFKYALRTVEYWVYNIKKSNNQNVCYYSLYNWSNRLYV